jgi:hypothetical protein
VPSIEIPAKALAIALILLVLILFIVDLGIYQYVSAKVINLAEIEKMNKLKMLTEPGYGQYFCAGFIYNQYSIDKYVNIVYGRKICDVDNIEVYEDIRIFINIPVGTWILSNVTKLYVFTKERVLVRIITEKPINDGTLHLILSGNNSVVIMDLSNKSEATILIPKGSHVYDVSMQLIIYKSGLYILRVGFYFEFI